MWMPTVPSGTQPLYADAEIKGTPAFRAADTRVLALSVLGRRAAQVTAALCWGRGPVPLHGAGPPQLSACPRRDPAAVCVQDEGLSEPPGSGTAPGLSSCRNGERGAQGELPPLTAHQALPRTKSTRVFLGRIRKWISLPLCYDSKAVCGICSLSSAAGRASEATRGRLVC